MVNNNGDRMIELLRSFDDRALENFAHYVNIHNSTWWAKYCKTLEDFLEELEIFKDCH